MFLKRIHIIKLQYHIFLYVTIYGCNNWTDVSKQLIMRKRKARIEIVY